MHRQLTSNVLSTGDLSRRTQNLLYDRDLVERYEDDPAGALAALHAAVVAGELGPDETAGVAELAFLHAENGGGSPYYLAAALYAWLYLFPDAPKVAPPSGFSPRFRLACDLYNRGLTAGLKNGENVELRSGTLPLPFGELDIELAPDALVWAGHQLVNFVPVAELEVKGFPTYYRWPGIGAPLAAGVVSQGERDQDLLGRRVRVAVTALLRPERLREQLAAQRVRARLEVYPGYDETKVKIAGQEVSLEAEPTAAMALTLAETKVWNLEATGFLRGAGVIEKRTQLVSMRPYRRGLIPFVFVHGTGSSAARWAQLANDLGNDPRLHPYYQFWFFSYSTGNPIAYSSMLLRESLANAVQKLDPEGKDPALRRMVVMGHSQGGLLTKATVVESGSRFWDYVSRKPIDELRASPETKDLLRRSLFVHPLPFVKRVIFLATPHHGSYVAGNWFAHQFARLIRAPLDVTKAITDVATLDQNDLAIKSIRGAPTSVDNMTPGNRFLQVLADLPVAPGVAAHSIIAVKDGVPSKTADDGVVRYESAHIGGVESELVVKSPHSCQANPHTIAEVKRILLEHLQLNADVVPRGDHK